MTRNEFKKRFLKARRRIIAGEFSHLNDMQQEAVMATEGPLLLLAGAGSGKTTVIINRIANILKYGRASDCDEIPPYATEAELEVLEAYADRATEEIPEDVKSICALERAEPWRVIAITFTNKAADELKSRLEAILGEQALDIWASTFHSACVRILRRDIERLGIYSRNFTIYDTVDSQSLIKRIVKDLELDEKMFPPRTVLTYLSNAKDQMQTAEDFIDQVSKTRDIRKKQIGEIYREYTKRMREANALDFDDLILITVKMLSEYEDVREYYSNKFKYVLVDEYQDTNKLQYNLVRLLAGKWNNICVVGDDDQGIYRFRGASIENILSFEDQYKNCRVIRLEQNYRSTGNILDAANAVISMNVARKGKELWTKNERGELITLYRAENESDEAQYVATQILEGFSQGLNWGDFAVLYRMNAQSNQLEYAFKRNGIPYRVIGGTKFFDRAEIKDMLAYLCVINNTNDDLRLLRIINNPPRGIGAKTVDTVSQIASEGGVPIYEVVKRAREYTELSGAANRLLGFVNLIEDLRSFAYTAPEGEAAQDTQPKPRPLDELYEYLLRRTGYIDMLEKKNPQENASRIENIWELKSNIITYMQENEDGSLAGFLDEIALYTDIEQLDESVDSAIMMTMHSAKGLEFPVVFIVGAEEGIFPGVRSIGEPEELEEERRLCYVAITRAKKKLYITAARQRMLFGRTSANRISRFVEEIPDAYMDKVQPGITIIRNTGFSAPRPKTEKSRIEWQEKKTVPVTEFRKGDRVHHKAFGEGLLISVTAMGGDALLEIAFDSVGTKRLLCNSAARHMKKIDV
ncbi:MAG: UvrD-helicase domain-containing protein [Clostridiales bacterium]|jgi:DNA helicase-2/ATP-dependent DNA helicase PcrA|nr:UvrD-helicase domain-containing protein [Clostridiales bacterium]